MCLCCCAISSPSFSGEIPLCNESSASLYTYCFYYSTLPHGNPSLKRQISNCPFLRGAYYSTRRICYICDIALLIITLFPVCYSVYNVAITILMHLHWCFYFYGAVQGGVDEQKGMCILNMNRCHHIAFQNMVTLHKCYLKQCIRIPFTHNPDNNRSYFFF